MATTHSHTIKPQIHTRNKIVSKDSKSWPWILLLGALYMLIGLAALATPFYSSLVTVFFLGSLLMIGGVVQIIHAFQLKVFKQILFRIAVGAIYFFVGMTIINSPMMGLLALSALIGGLLAIEGVIKSVIAYELKPEDNWGWVFFSGLCSFSLAVMIYAGFPDTALWIIGLFVGINFVFDGASMAMLSVTLKKQKKALFK